MSNICKKSDVKVLFSQEKVGKRIQEIAQELNAKYKNSDSVMFICVLSGAFMFFSELVKNVENLVDIQFIKVSSYGNQTSTSGEIKEILLNLPDLSDKDVVLVDDIVDSGVTAKYLIKRIKDDFHAKSLCFVSLLDKKCRRKTDINPDICGFEIDDKFIVECDGVEDKIPSKVSNMKKQTIFERTGLKVSRISKREWQYSEKACIDRVINCNL